MDPNPRRTRSCGSPIWSRSTWTALTIAVLILFVGTPSAEQFGIVTGRVLDDAGAPVASAPVEARAGSQAPVRVVAAADGTFSFQLPPGSYELSVPVTVFGFERKRVTVRPSETVQVVLRLIDLGISLNTIGEDLASRVAAANRPPPPEGPTPRLTNGTPDLSGVWWAPTTVDPGQTEMLPAAAAVFEERKANFMKDSPSARCLPDGVLRLSPWFKLIETPALVITLLDGEVPGYRQVFLDGRLHPPDIDPTWYGHSVGRWEEDTLVIDTIGFNDRRWLSAGGQPMTARLHLTERMRRPDFGHLEIEARIDDPGAYAKPWTVKRLANLAPGEEIEEYICENNKDVEHLVGK